MSQVQRALQRVQAAAEQDAKGSPVAHVAFLKEIGALRDAVESPDERLMRMRFHQNETLCIRVLIEYGVLQAIASKNGQEVSAAQLAKETGADELLIIRCMRLVTFTKVAEETGHARYTSNETTKMITTRGGIGGELLHTDLGWGVGSKLVEMIRKKQFCQFPDEPGQVVPFEFAFGKSLFGYMQQNQEQKRAFDDYMAFRRSAKESQWFETYPVAQEIGELKGGQDAVLMVDVGGGLGHEAKKFHQRFPRYPGKLIVQDLPITLKNATAPAGVELMHHDFFTEQPIKGARIYYMRTILHSWSDKKSEAILSRITKAMDPSYSRLLIHDYVLPDTGADRHSAGMDFIQLMLAQGIERTSS